MTKAVRSFVSLIFGLSLLVGSTLAVAEDAAIDSPAKSESLDTESESPDTESVILDTMTVIGTKVGRDRQETYTSTGVLTGKEAKDLQVQDFREAMLLQGNVYVAPSNNGNNGISIRGINSEGIGEPGANVRPMMNMNVDGASQSVEGIRRGQRGVWDIKQIEVARGPQSTIQGRNALAGAITIETNDPTPYWEGAARFTGSSMDGLAPAAMLSGPIIGGLSFRLSGEYLYEEKDILYSEPAAEFFREDEYRNVRGKLLFQPDFLPELSVKFTLSDTTDKPAVPAVSPPNFDRVFNVEESAAEKRENDVMSIVLDASYELGGGFVLRSISAFIDTDAMITGTGAAGYSRDEIREDSDITQEFRLVRNVPDSVWTGVLGFFYGDFTNDRDSLVKGGGSTIQDLVSEREDTNIAGFGEIRLSLGNHWGVSFGARYTVDTSDQWTLNKKDALVIESEYESSAFLPQASLIYRVDEAQSIAFSVSRGYRSGFNEEGRTIDPEFLTSYEIAYRLIVLNGALVFNADLFYYDWDDMQVSVPIGLFGETYTENAGSASAQGLELMLYWKPPVTGMTVGASLGLLRTRLDDYKSEIGDVDFSGNEFPEAPPYSGSLWAVYRFGNHWFASADYVFRGSAFATSDLANQEDKKVPAYHVVDARFGYEHKHFSIILGIRNLLDEEYITGRDIRDGAYIGDARTYTGTISAYF
jgi:outer membrane receptor protein involved in Fe transport